MNDMYEQKIRMYRLEPGDGTRYTMGVAPLAADAGQVIAGVGTGTGYALLIIMMSGGSGAVILRRWELENPKIGFDYAMSHGLAACQTYTVIACMLAAARLLVDPHNISGAEEAMLYTPKILESMR